MKGIFTLFITLLISSGALFAQPANDDCANAIAIGEVTDYAFENINATTDGPSHPNDCVSSGTTPDSTYNDIWYLYTASFTGSAEWSMCSTADFDTKIFVYNAGVTCMPTDNDVLACSEDGGSCDFATSVVIFPVTMGETYLLRLGAYGDGSPGEEGDGTFFIAEADPPPANDLCENATEVFIGLSQPFETFNAGTDGPEHPTAPCFAFGNDFVNSDIWYYFTAPNNADIEWSTCDSAFYDTRLAVYEGGPGDCPMEDMDLLACNDDGAGCEGFTSFLTFTATAGTTYLLRLGGYLPDDQGTGTFDLVETVIPDPPVNDECETSAIGVNVVYRDSADMGIGLIEGTTSAATQDGPVPTCTTNGEIFDVWYTFNSGVDTVLEFRMAVQSQDADFFVEIFSDCMANPIDTANGGTLSETCFYYEYDTNPFDRDTVYGFPGVPTDYYMRVSTNITFDLPGDFWMYVVSFEEPIVGTDDLYSLEKVRLFPNPVDQETKLELTLDESARTTYEVFNSVGQAIRRTDAGTLTSGTHVLDINTADLSAGVYFLKVRADDKSRIMKFVKN